MSHRLKVYAVRAVTAAAAVALWLYAQGPGDVSPIILPKLDRVISEFWKFLTSADVYRAAGVTIGEIFVALFIAGVLGFAVGFWAARTQLRAAVVEPLLVWGYLVPHILFYPLIILWFGVGVSSKIVYAASSAVFPIAFNCLRGFRGVDPSFLNVGRAYGASPRQMDWMIKLRAGLPMAAAGLRLGAALCMITVIVAEMLASTRGLGYLLKFYSQSFSTARVYAIIFVVLIIVGAFQFAVKKLLPVDPGAAR